jgi:hypothetical protein
MSMDGALVESLSTSGKLLKAPVQNLRLGYRLG